MLRICTAVLVYRQPQVGCHQQVLSVALLCYGTGTRLNGTVRWYKRSSSVYGVLRTVYR
jgi:hypothetical protein